MFRCSVTRRLATSTKLSWHRRSVTARCWPTVPLPIHLPTARRTSETFIEAGELLTEAFNDGPAYWDPTSNTINLIPSRPI